MISTRIKFDDKKNTIYLIKKNRLRISSKLVKSKDLIWII